METLLGKTLVELQEALLVQLLAQQELLAELQP